MRAWEQDVRGRDWSGMGRLVARVERLGGELCKGVGTDTEEFLRCYPRVTASGTEGSVRVVLHILGHATRRSPCKGGLGQRLMCRALASTWCPKHEERTCQRMDEVYGVIVVDFLNADYYYYKVTYI